MLTLILIQKVKAPDLTAGERISETGPWSRKFLVDARYKPSLKTSVNIRVTWQWR